MDEKGLAPARQRLGIRWTLTSFTGWGVFGVNLARDLTRRGLAHPIPLAESHLLTPAAEADPLLAPALAEQQRAAVLLKKATEPLTFDFPVLHGLGNGLSAGSLSERIRGTPDIGVVFLEDTDPGPALQRSSRYRLLLAGSSWNADVLRGFGIERTAVCLQGVDTTIFRPREKRNVLPGRFVIFSGGKLEFRKGQDIVISAFRTFHARHPDALLLTAWSSPFPDAAADLARSPHRVGVPRAADDLSAVAEWLQANGLPPESVALLSPMPNEEMAGWLSEADAAVFASRAEGGTNLPAMECLASGVPTILSANTGHFDLISSVPCYAVDSRTPVERASGGGGTAGWGETNPAAIVEMLERIYADKESSKARGSDAARAMAAGWSWPDRVDRILDALTKAGVWQSGTT